MVTRIRKPDYFTRRLMNTTSKNCMNIVNIIAFTETNYFLYVLFYKTTCWICFVRLKLRKFKTK